MAPTTPFVRPYDPSRDFEHGLHVFFTTADPSLNEEPARTIGSHIWYRPYISLTPSTCFVLDDGEGRVVGYCIGTEDTASFAQRWRDVFAPSVDHKLIPPPDVQTADVLMEKDDIKHLRKAVHEAECSMLQPWPQMLQQYPAHMHIDILPEFQRKGWGTVLINRLFGMVKSLGARGLHLGMVQSNVGGRAFYEKIGFEVCLQVLDGGKSGNTGVDGAVITLVKAL